MNLPSSFAPITIVTTMRDRIFDLAVLLVFTASLIGVNCGCSPSRCTSHPYDPKAACAAPGANLGPADAGAQ